MALFFAGIGDIVAVARERVGPLTVASDFEQLVSQRPDELLGLRLGMSAWAARRILEKQGFRVLGFDKGESWSALVGRQTSTSVPRQWRGSVNGASFAGAGGAIVKLSFVQTPGGAALSRLQLQMPETGLPMSLGAALAQRFDRPECADTGCLAPLAAAVGNPATELATLTVDPDQRVIALDASAELQRLADVSITDAVRECRRSRLGVPVDVPARFVFGC